MSHQSPSTYRLVTFPRRLLHAQQPREICVLFLALDTFQLLVLPSELIALWGSASVLALTIIS